MDKKVYMIIQAVELNKAGMTAAMLTRSKVFYEHNVNGDIITFDYNINYETTKQKLVKVGKMDARTNIINMYDYLDEISSEKVTLKHRKKLSFHNQILKDLSNLISVENDGKSSRYFDINTGDYLFYVKYKKDEEIDFVDEMLNFKRVKRKFFYNSKLKKITTFNYENSIISETYFNKYEIPFLIVQKNPQTGAIGNNHLLQENLTFKNNTELAKYFLKSYIGDEQCSIIVDGPGSFPKILDLNLKNTKIYSIMHSDHLDYERNLKKTIKFIFDNANKVDGIITFTNKHKKDLVEQYNLSNVLVIPNFQFSNNNFVVKNKNKSLIVSNISRLVKGKGFDRLCRVAEEVRKKEKNIKFHLYGLGPYEEEILKMITTSNLQDTVFLKGYTNDIISKLENEIGLLISTSYSEAFGLSISEAMERGVPAISFDIKYGPSDIIVNEETGYLVEDGDIYTMAEKIIYLYNNPNILAEFGKNSRNRILKEFASHKIMDLWLEII